MPPLPLPSSPGSLDTLSPACPFARLARRLVNLRIDQAPSRRVVDIVDLVGGRESLELVLLPQSFPSDHDRNRALSDQIVRK